MVFLFSRRTLHPHARRQFRDIFRHPEVEGVAALTESGDQDAVSGLRLFEGRHEHDQRMGGARLAADLMHVVDDLLRRGPELFGQGAVLRLEETREDELVHILHGDIELFKEAVRPPPE